jgi:Sel1 repeat
MPITAVLLSVVLVLCSIPQMAGAGLDSGVSAFERGDYQTAQQELRPLAESGNPKAQYYIGLMAYSGKGVAPDSAEAIKWIKPAAENGMADAQYIYALLLEGGTPGAAGKIEAIKWFTLASDQGHVDAQMKLVDRYSRGDGIKPNLVQAYTWCGVAHLHVPSRCNPQESVSAYQMTAEQKEDAKRNVQQWVTRHPVNTSHPSFKSAQRLIAELDRADFKKKEEIKASLVRMGNVSTPAMLEALHQRTFAHTKLLTDVLCERGPESSSAIPELIRLLNDPSVLQPINSHFLSSLACIGKTSPEVQSFLISLLKGGSDAMRPWAAMLLENFESKEAVLALADALDDSRRTVRETAVRVLLSMGPKAAPAVPALSKLMEQRGTYLASAAGDALAAIGTPEAIAEIKRHHTE